MTPTGHFTSTKTEGARAAGMHSTSAVSTRIVVIGSLLAALVAAMFLM